MPAPVGGPCSTRQSAAYMPHSFAPAEAGRGGPGPAVPRRSVLLVAHGSRDPRAAGTTRALARTVAAVRPGLDVRVAFLELSRPGPAEVLAVMPAGTVVVPLLLTRAYHGAVDLPAQVAGFDCVIT